MTDYKKINLRGLENMSVKYGHDKDMEARFATKSLGLKKSGLGIQKVMPNRTVPFKHRHKQQEEVFIFLSGMGKMHLDDETVEVGPMDAVRVSPEVLRTVQAGNEGLEMLIVGAPFLEESDVEIVKG